MGLYHRPCPCNVLLVYTVFCQTVLNCWAMRYIVGKYLENVPDWSVIYRSSLTNSSTRCTREPFLTAFLSRGAVPHSASQVARYIPHPNQVKFYFLLRKPLNTLPWRWSLYSTVCITEINKGNEIRHCWFTCDSSVTHLCLICRGCFSLAQKSRC